MRTTLNIDDALMAKAQARFPGLTKTALIEAALKELIRKSARERLIAAGGTLPDLEDPPRRRPT